MAKLILNETVVKVKSEELHIPFSNLLPAALIEYLLYQITESGFGENLWLKNSSSLGLESYRRKPVFELSFYYVKPLEEAGLSALLDEIFSVEASTEQDIRFTYQIEQDRTRALGTTADRYRVDILAQLGIMQVPLTIRIEIMDNPVMEPNRGEHRLFIKNNQVISFWQYPSEQRIAECFVTILEKMELINDLSNYQAVYYILSKEPLDGRRVQQQIMEYAKVRELILNDNRLTTILNYRNYTYMKKKWHSYLKQEKKKTPSWEDVINKMEHFFVPVWNAIMEDTIYIGDWMPELARFLD